MCVTNKNIRKRLFTFIYQCQYLTRLNSRQRKELYVIVFARQGGEYCAMCGRTRLQLVKDGLSSNLCIDHKDNNNNNNRLSNLQFLCHSCNTKKNHPTIEDPQQRVMTPEMALGRAYEKKFRKWVSGLIQSPEYHGLLQYDFIVHSGAERIGCSPETIKRYLKKMTSKAGAYEWIERDEIYLKLKDSYLQ